MAGFLDMLAKTATDAASRAGAKAEELMEVNKYKSRQSELKGNVAKAKRKIGDYCLKLYQDGELTDDKLIELCQEIEKIAAEIRDLDDKIIEAHENARAKQPDYDGDRL